MPKKKEPKSKIDPTKWVPHQGEFRTVKLPPNQPDPGQLFKVGPTVINNLTEH